MEHWDNVYSSQKYISTEAETLWIKKKKKTPCQISEIILYGDDILQKGFFLQPPT